MNLPLRPPAEKKLPRDEWKKLIRENAYNVWSILLPRRDGLGVTVASIRTIIENGKGLTPKKVKGAFRLLAEVGAIENLGPMKLASGAKVYRRRVVGRMPNRKLVYLPPEVISKAKALMSWGGSRKGAGHTKPLSHAASEIQVGPSHVSRGTPPGPIKRDPHLQIVKPLQQKETKAEEGSLLKASGSHLNDPKVGSHLKGKNESSGTLKTESSGSVELEASKELPSLVEVFPSEKLTATVPVARLDSIQKQPVGGLQGQTGYDPRVGAFLRGKKGPRLRTPEEITADPHVPRYPSAELLGLAKVPDPNPPSAKALPETLAEEALQVYRRAHERSTGKKCSAWFKGYEASPAYPKVTAGCLALQEHGIPFFTWAAWSFDTWEDNGMGGPKCRLPPIEWAFSAERVEKHHRWFSSEASGYMGGRNVFGPKAKTLVTRYQEMLLSARNPHLDVGEVVAEFFPGDSYARMLKAAQDESREKQDELDEAVERGEWVWS